MSISDDLLCAEFELRECFGLECFLIGKNKKEVFGRASGDDISENYDTAGESNRRKHSVTLDAVFLKDEFPGVPHHGGQVIWKCEGGEDIKMKIGRVSGKLSRSPVWAVSMRSI